MMRLPLTLLVCLCLSSCFLQSKATRTANERKHPARYLKGTIISLHQVNDTTIHASIRVKSKARFVTYHNVEVHCYLIKANGDTACEDFHPVSKDDFKPRQKVIREIDFSCQSAYTKIKLDYVTGVPPLPPVK